MNNDLTNECYTLVHNNMWVGVKGFQIRIHTTADGVVVDIYKGNESGAYGERIAQTYAFDFECLKDEASEAWR